MAKLDAKLRELGELRGQIRDEGVPGFLMLTDLAGSTLYKTRHSEDVWLPRLFNFYNAVNAALSPYVPCKYLGDGILTFLPQSTIDAGGIIALARKVHETVETANATHHYRHENRIGIRTVLGGGRVHLYNGNDPQGTAVDTLFRMEKFVPEGCIGLLDSVHACVTNDKVCVGAYRVKGLSESRQRLWLLPMNCTPDSKAVRDARLLAMLYDIWDLGDDFGGSISIINGYVPELANGPATIQLGDMRAEQLVYSNLVRVGRVGDCQWLTTRDHDEKHLSQNVICLGGPYYNTATRRLMQELHLPLRFDLAAKDDRSPLVDGLYNVTFESARQDGALSRDYGFFVRARNPLNERCHVILVAGIETHAVGGIVEAFGLDNARFGDLHRTIRGDLPEDAGLPEFYCVLPFQVQRTGRTMLPSLDEQKRHICREWDRGGAWATQDDPPDEGASA